MQKSLREKVAVLRWLFRELSDELTRLLEERPSHATMSRNYRLVSFVAQELAKLYDQLKPRSTGKTVADRGSFNVSLYQQYVSSLFRKLDWKTKVRILRQIQAKLKRRRAHFVTIQNYLRSKIRKERAMRSPTFVGWW